MLCKHGGLTQREAGRLLGNERGAAATLPRPFTVVDAFTGELVSGGAAEMNVEMRRGETGVWRLREEADERE